MAAPRDLAVFYRTLAQLLGSGVIASEALRGCAGAVPEAAEAANRVAGGEPLSAALARHREIFPDEHVRLLEIGERSGFLDTVLAELGDYSEQTARARRTLISGLTFPVFIVHVAAFLTPLPLLILGDSIGGYLLAVFGFLAAFWAAVAVLIWLPRVASPAALNAVLTRIPVVRDAWRDLDYWRVASCLRMYTRTSAGLPLALRFTASVCRGPGIATALRGAADAVEQRSEPASPTLRATGEFPVEMMLFWANGEQSGRLDVEFARMAARYAESFHQRMDAVARWLPRLAYGLVCIHLVIQIFRLAGGYREYLNHS
ncbi:MAG: hypothetical protein A3G75_10985 [Verrucomicrobia bacterium RIFCSPLOWO2_12_FULL_64_8]|nr:MAG: hypothetical protein A3G75_10985 [Verrucomicrobia bacterium RIFCSPLOWO2_12_FULL_64_8]